MTTYKMWDNVPGTINNYEPVLEFYPAEVKKTDATAVILPGGAYSGLAGHEGRDYALYLNSIGMNAFVCEYRVAPVSFPYPLLDARRAIRFVRANAEKFGIDKNKVAIMGSSAGGHLAALTSTYTDVIDGERVDEIDNEPFMPNVTVLCYAVIHYPDESDISHVDSYYNLTGDVNADFSKYSPDLLVSDDTPTAFIWHTSEDPGVNVINSYRYAEALRKHNIPHEMHIFPYGGHGAGLAVGKPHIAQWTSLLINWFREIGWLSE